MAADEFTANQVQGVFGEFKAVLDFADVTVTAENVQGVFGEFMAVLDEAATAGAGGLGIPIAAFHYMHHLKTMAN